MKIRITSSVLVAGVWHEPGIGNYEPELAEHLISLGAAEPYETKISIPTELKKNAIPPGSVSPQGQVSQNPTVKKSRGRRRKS